MKLINSNCIAVLVVGAGGLFGYLLGYYAPIDGLEYISDNGDDDDDHATIANTIFDENGNSCDDESASNNPFCSPPSSGPKEKKTRTTIGGDGSLLPVGQCGLYLAPSSLPHAGLGLYSGSPHIPYEHSVNEYIGGTFPGYSDDSDPPLWTDLYVPIADELKALPYRGQQRFPSWLQYIWPEEPGAMSDFDTKPFPFIPQHMWDFDQGLDSADGLDFFLDDYIDEDSLEWRHPEVKVNAFVPGLASLVNHHSRFSNMVRIRRKSRRDYTGQVAPWHAGAGAFTPHHGVEFYVTKRGGIYEGMELLLDYGETWNRKNKEKLEWIAYNNKKKKQGVRSRKGFVDGIAKKWDHVDERELKNCPEELPTEKAKRDRLAEGKAADSSDFKEGEKPYSDYRVNDFHPSSWNDKNKTDDMPYSWLRNSTENDDDDDDEDFQDVRHHTDIIKPLSWLDQNGVCLSSGKLKVGASAVKFAGRGLFAATNIGEGEVVLTSPLLAMREEDFTIYKSDNEQLFVRDIIDKTTVVGQELLLNYAFTHPDSPLYLVPSAPLANFINHGLRANVEVRWPSTGSNSAKLFQWAYKQEHGNHFDNNFEKTEFNDPNPWLKDHPIDVMERSGKLALEYVALRDIDPGEEIRLDYGEVWRTAWKEFNKRHPYARSGYFRHAIGVPSGFFPDNWLHVSDRYEIAELQDLENNPLVPGKAVPMTWAHNGKPVGSKYAYVVGLEKGFSEKFLDYSEKKGVVELYRKLLTEQEGYHLPSDGFGVYHPATLVNNTTSEGDAFFAHRYHSTAWRFNMHFVAAWEESARKDVLKALGDAGFDIALQGIGERFGYDNLTCFHASYMGVTHCDKSKMHSDIYATNDKSWNIVFPIITVEGTDPELDVMSENMNTVIGVHYLKDVAYAMGDFGFHQTRPNKYYDPGDGDDAVQDDAPIRVVFGTYCAQIDETNVAMIRHIYDGDDPAPFADQFENLPMKEIHWDKVGGTYSLATPEG